MAVAAPEDKTLDKKSMKSLLERRGELRNEAKDLIDKRGRKDSDFTETDREKYDTLLQEIDSVNEAIEMKNKLADRVAIDPTTLEGGDESMKKMLAQMGVKFQDAGTDGASLLPEIEFRAGSAGCKYVPMDLEMVPEKEHFLYGDLYKKSFKAGVRDPSRDFESIVSRMYNAGCDGEGVSTASFNDGGWLTAPLQFVSGIMKCCDKRVKFRQMARVFTVTQAAALGVRKRTEKATASAWDCECTEPPKSNPKGTVVTLEPHILSTCTKMCRELIRHSVENVESFFLDEMSIAIAEAMEQAYLFGDGIKQPLGILREGAIANERYLPFDVSADTFDGDWVIDLLCSIPECYQGGNLTWMMSREMWCAILKLKTSSGYLWSATADRGLASGVPLSLLGIPVIVNEFMSGHADVAETPGNVPMILMDASQYWIADRNRMENERETCAGKDQVSGYSRVWTGGMPMCDEAFAPLLLVE